MIKFLIQRPIAVLMAFTACFIVGLVTYFTLPVSLLPVVSAWVIAPVTVTGSAIAGAAYNPIPKMLERITAVQLRCSLLPIKIARSPLRTAGLPPFTYTENAP